MIYRVIKRLSVGKRTGYIEPGGMVTDDSLGIRVATILVEKGAISPISAPPLDALPGWKLRAKKFEAAGYDAINLLECDAELIARETGYQEKSIEKWKRELMKFLEVEPAKARRGCGDCDEEAEPKLEPEPEVKEVELIEQVEQTEEVLEHATDE
jgi:hypothetical protein